MLYAFKKQIGESYKYIAGAKEPQEVPYSSSSITYTYTDSLLTARLFDSVSNAINWLERAAFRNGERNLSYDGNLCLIQVKLMPVQYKEIGLVE